jgi:leucyl-tRNA synthetase
MKGDAVLHPMGWDAFGLPAENEAILRGRHPRDTTAEYAGNYRDQLDLLGCSYDWEREIDSSSPDYYRWTQWFFLLLHERGLAYRAPGRQWWCPVCETVLANEQVEAGGVCWRGHEGVHRRDLVQWHFRITEYADRLLDGLDALDWPERVKTAQRNWIGRSEGVEITMPSVDGGFSLDVFTTRPETVCGVTFVALAPEHPLAQEIATASRRERVERYCREAAQRSDLDRGRQDGAMTGEFTGAYVVNPVNDTRTPVFVADYVLMGYASGAVMGVPAHDARDFAFAAARDIPTQVVVAPAGWDGASLTEAHTGDGLMVHSGRWDGMGCSDAARSIADWVEARGVGRRAVKYRLRDWLISRQRYWGAPIPIVHCDSCGVVPVPAAELPVVLPDIDRWEPGGDGRSPLANVPQFTHTDCPRCGEPSRRETDTMDGFACSSWYFLRYLSPAYADAAFDPRALEDWWRTDLYVGGADHATMHLLYARFWTHVMADAGITPFHEPFPKLRCQGVMHARDAATGRVSRMSKSTGNVVTPNEVADKHGVDTLRVHVLFMAPFEDDCVWDEEGISGSRRFLERAWRLARDIASRPALEGEDADLARLRDETIRRVESDIERLSFNTAIARLMELLNALTPRLRQEGPTAEIAEATRTFALLLAPFAPHIAEELWRMLGGEGSVHGQAWPQAEAEPTPDTVTLVVQVDGRVRARVEARADIQEADAVSLALEGPGIAECLRGREVTRTVHVPGRLVNLVTAPTA